VPQQVLQPPQVQPTVGNAPPVSDWHSIHHGFTHTFKLLRGLSLYLQTYLTNVYNAVVPRQYVLVTLDATLSPYTVGATESYVAAFAGVAADTIVLLPAATGSGRELEISKRDGNAFNIAVTPFGTDTINDTTGAANITIQYDALRLRDIGVGQWAAG
jgi:hypothetical protein